MDHTLKTRLENIADAVHLVIVNSQSLDFEEMPIPVLRQIAENNATQLRNLENVERWIKETAGWENA